MMENFKLGNLVFVNLFNLMKGGFTSRGELGEEMDEVLGVKPGIGACSVVYVLSGGSC